MVAMQSSLGLRVVVLLAFASAVGCGREPPAQAPSFQVRLLTPMAVTGHWEREAERGLGRLAVELEADVARVRVADPTRAQEEIRKLTAGGADLIICVGGSLERAVLLEAPAHPDTAFLSLPGQVRQANVAAIEFRLEGAGYLAGVVAAVLAERGQVGLLRGEGGPWLEDLEDGFLTALGSRADGDVQTVPVERDGASEVRSLSRSGVKLALYAADEPRIAVVESAAADGLGLVVMDPDLMARRPGTIYAAVIVDVAESIVRVAREVQDGRFVGRVFSFDLGSGVVDVALSETLPPDRLQAAQDALEVARSEVTAGIVEIEELGL
jgi:basic membrane lipoprotein Med (substrate-binding protein (PBP1-ABC) superfamily)